MGFLDIIGSIAGVANQLLNPTPAPPAPRQLTTAAVLPAGTTIAQAATRGLATDPVLRARIAAVGGDPLPTILPGQRGAANVFTRTVIQRVSRETGDVLSETTKMGSPWLMRSEVRALKRVTKAIRKADSKISRKAASVSVEAIDKAVAARVTQNLLLTSMQHHGHHGA